MKRRKQRDVTGKVFASIAQPKKRGSTKLFLEGKLPLRLRWFLEELQGTKFSSSRCLAPLDPRLFELIQHYVKDLEPDEAVREWYNEILSKEKQAIAIKELDDIDLGDTCRELKPYQRVAVEFALQNRRCILGDDVGMGKTVEAIKAVQLSNHLRHVLVVCTNSMKYTWQAEINRWFPGQQIVIVEAESRDKDVRSFKRGFLILNWELIRLLPQLRLFVWNCIIADEAHRLKNRKAQVSIAFSKLKSAWMLMLTATPCANHPGELWHLLHLLRPEKYTSHSRFFNMYVRTVRTHSGFVQIDKGHPEKNPTLLRRELAPIMINRDRRDYLQQLPPQIRTVLLDLTVEQKRLYKQMAKSMYVELDSGEEIDALNVAVQLMRLRQIISTTATLQESDYSSKLDAVMSIIEDSPLNNQFVVFAQFRATVNSLEKRLLASKITCAKLMGAMGSKRAFAAVEQFQSGKARVFVATTRAGGEGVTLTASHQIIIVEKDFNPAKQTQAIGRVDRFGQTEQCLVTYLHCSHTVDDWVNDITLPKQGMIDSILRDKLKAHLQDSIDYLGGHCET